MAGRVPALLALTALGTGGGRWPGGGSFFPCGGGGCPAFLSWEGGGEGGGTRLIWIGIGGRLERNLAGLAVPLPSWPGLSGPPVQARVPRRGARTTRAMT